MPKQKPEPLAQKQPLAGSQGGTGAAPVVESLYDHDYLYYKKYGLVCGVDEAGCGPLCGPVSVGAVVLDMDNPIEGVNDSKKLTEKKREALYDEIVEKAIAWRVVMVPPAVIDEINILQARLLGMRQAVEQLLEETAPAYVLVDGNRLPDLALQSECIRKGDAKSASIAAASILAKVTRDRYMVELDKQYPQYQLAKHKGYPTKLHYELLAQHGVQDFYRKTFLTKRGIV